MEIKIETNLAELDVWLNQRVIKQAKFATSVALYETAKQAADTVRNQLPQDFTIRNTYVGKGIRVRPSGSKAIRATGRGIEGMEAQVGTLDEFMARQELGGKKEGTGGKDIAIPIRENPSDITTKSKWPKALMRKKNFFIQPYKGYRAMFERTEKTRYPIKIRYWFKPTVNVNKRWRMIDTITEVVAQHYDKNFEDAFNRAMKTAR